MFLEGVRHRNQVIMETGRDKEAECNYPGKQSFKLLLFGFLTSGFHCSWFAFPYWSLFPSAGSSKYKRQVCILAIILNIMAKFQMRSVRKLLLAPSKSGTSSVFIPLLSSSFFLPPRLRMFYLTFRFRGTDSNWFLLPVFVLHTSDILLNYIAGTSLTR